jgi:hypothetical protein
VGIDDALRPHVRLAPWRFSAHHEVGVAGEDAAWRKKLAGYMLRAVMFLQKMIDEVATGTVIYRSKMHAGMTRRFPVIVGRRAVGVSLRTLSRPLRAISAFRGVVLELRALGAWDRGRIEFPVAP